MNRINYDHFEFQLNKINLDRFDFNATTDLGHIIPIWIDLISIPP